MKRPIPAKKGPPPGPTQRQLRAGELIRHALVDILREVEINDPALAGVSITVTEVRMNTDLRHAAVFVEPLGGGHADAVVSAMNRHKKFVRGRLGKLIDMRFTPEVRFVHDESFNEVARMSRLLDDPHVRQDLTPDEPSPAWKDET